MEILIEFFGVEIAQFHAGFFKGDIFKMCLMNHLGGVFIADIRS